MKAPRWLSAVAKRIRAPLWIWWNLMKAALGNRVGNYLDRPRTSPGQKLAWRIALTLGLLIKAWPMFVGACVVGALLAVGIPLGLYVAYLYGSFSEIWRDA